MENVINILVMLPIKEERHREKLKSAYPEANFIFKERITQEDVKDINIVIGNIPPKFLKCENKIKWIQLGSAGADPYLKEGVMPNGAVLTNATGAFGLAVSEHMLAGTLLLIKKLNKYILNQKEHLWHDEGEVTSIYNSRTLILGMGDIGSEYGKKMKALGSYVVGIKKNIADKPEWVDELYTMEKLEEELPKADIVAMSLPSNAETKRIMDYKRFSLMKKSAILINAGRGDAVATDDLVKALNEGLIFGAFLDVTDPEPLPAGHPLWDAKNAVITPHISGWFHLKDILEKIIDISVENLKRFKQGGELINIVDPKTGYRKS